SGIMYSAMIVFGLGSVIYFVRYAFDSILPLRWSLTEPISDFPLDLLVFHIVVPVTVDWAKPRELFRALFEKWWHVTAQQLRLTSFMFGNRYPEEEGTHYRKTWRALLLGRKAPIPRLGIDTNNEDQNAEVVFVKDGGFVRAPSFDGVPVVPGRRMLIPVNEQGELINPNDTPPVGEDDQLHHTVVYVPPSFKARVIFFLFLMWFCGSIFCCSVTILPLLMGRFIFQSLLHYQQPVHDLYAFTVGLYVMWTLGVGMEWIVRKFQILKEQQIWKVDWPVLREKLVSGTLIFLKISYLFVAFGIVMPFLFSLVIELYFILPWKKYSSNPPPISFLQDWALGIVYMKIAYRIVFMLPDNTFSRTINEITGRGIRNLDVKLATNMFIIPIGGIGLVAVFLPALNAWLILFAAGKSTQLIQNWMQTVRDEEYRIGLRLHNIEPNEPAANVPVSSSSNTNNDNENNNIPIPQNAG
ncbi:9053_t:CDS:2, partial [Ambispora leptoticha]